MKKAEIFLYSLYAVGIVLKLFKLPMHAVFILVVLLALIVYYMACLIRKNKDRYLTITGLVTTLWLFCWLTILKHFPFHNIVLIVSILASIILFFPLYKKRKLTKVNTLFCLVIILITVFFRILPTHTTYYLTNIKFNYEIESDYISWDKYSWFLYKEGRIDEAIQANKNAQTAAEKSIQHSKHGNANEYLYFIKEHEDAIKNGSWTRYH